MILLEYLLAILLLGLCYFILTRLRLIYQRNAQHLFWKRKIAGRCYFAAAVLALSALIAYVEDLHPVFPTVLLWASYFCVAAASVKINEQGILANGFFITWHEVLAAKRIALSEQIAIIARRPWQRVRLRVPDELEPRFKKMLASKGIRVEEMEESHPEISEPDLPLVEQLDNEERRV